MGSSLSGQPSFEELRLKTERNIYQAAPLASLRLAEHIETGDKIETVTVDICKFVINHAIGMPTQKQLVAGDVKITVSYKTIEPSTSEVIKEEVRPLSQLPSPVPSVAQPQAQVMSVQDIKAVQEDIYRATHE